MGKGRMELPGFFCGSAFVQKIKAASCTQEMTSLTSKPCRILCCRVFPPPNCNTVYKRWLRRRVQKRENKVYY